MSILSEQSNIDQPMKRLKLVIVYLEIVVGVIRGIDIMLSIEMDRISTIALGADKICFNCGVFLYYL